MCFFWHLLSAGVSVWRVPWGFLTFYINDILFDLEYENHWKLRAPAAFKCDLMIEVIKALRFWRRIADTLFTAYNVADATAQFAMPYVTCTMSWQHASVSVCWVTLKVLAAGEWMNIVSLKVRSVFCCWVGCVFDGETAHLWLAEWGVDYVLYIKELNFTYEFLSGTTSLTRPHHVSKYLTELMKNWWNPLRIWFHKTSYLFAICFAMLKR